MVRLAAPQSLAVFCWMNGTRWRRPAKASLSSAGKRSWSLPSGAAASAGLPFVPSLSIVVAVSGVSGTGALPGFEKGLQGRDQRHQHALRAGAHLGPGQHAVMVAAHLPLGL